MTALKNLILNSRFYVLSFAVLGSLLILAYFRSIYVSDQLFYIRVEQLYGLIATILVYLAVIITPLSKLIPSAGWIKKLLFARRAIGVAAAYYALLHTYIVIQEQLGGLGGITILPTRFKISFALAFIALAILVAMAATSLDKAIQIMTFKRWKQLHRYVYLAGILIVVHIWMIGTHVDYAAIRYVSYVALGILFLLESLRLSVSISKKYRLDNSSRYVVALGLCAVSFIGLVVLSSLAQENHNQHEDYSMTGHSESNSMKEMSH